MIILLDEDYKILTGKQYASDAMSYESQNSGSGVGKSWSRYSLQYIVTPAQTRLLQLIIKCTS